MELLKEKQEVTARSVHATGSRKTKKLVTDQWSVILKDRIARGCLGEGLNEEEQHH